LHASRIENLMQAPAFLQVHRFCKTRPTPLRLVEILAGPTLDHSTAIVV
jgi:hypothetical protein